MLDILAQFGLHQALRKGIPMLQHRRTKRMSRPDNSFASEHTLDLLLWCKVMADLTPTRTDHMPIETIYELPIERHQEAEKRNFREVNWEEFNADLRDRLRDIPRRERIENEGEL